MIAKLGSAVRAFGSLPPDSDLEDLTRFGRAVGPERYSLACYGDEARAQRKRPPRRNRAGAVLGELPSYVKRLPAARERAVLAYPRSDGSTALSGSSGNGGLFRAGDSNYGRATCGGPADRA